jgi:hypothetical protein
MAVKVKRSYVTSGKVQEDDVALNIAAIRMMREAQYHDLPA